MIKRAIATALFGGAEGQPECWGLGDPAGDVAFADGEALDGVAAHHLGADACDNAGCFGVVDSARNAEACVCGYCRVAECGEDNEGEDRAHVGGIGLAGWGGL